MTEKRLWRAALWLLFSTLSLVLLFMTAKAGGFDIFDFTPDNVIPPLPVYAGDFSLGFASRLFIGTVTGLFSFELGYEKIKLICGVAVFISLVLTLLMCGRILQQAVEYKSFFVFYVVLILLMIPMISQENLKVYGSFDTYWLILFVLCIALFAVKGFYSAVPLLCFAAVLVHYGFLISFFPALAALCVYIFFNADKKSEKIASASAFGITAACGGLTVYSLLFFNDRLRMTADEFHEYLLARLNLTGVEKIRLSSYFGENLFSKAFYEGYFFDTRYGDNEKGTTLKLLIYGMTKLMKDIPAKVYLSYFAATVPVLLLFGFVWCLCIKKRTGLKNFRSSVLSPCSSLCSSEFFCRPTCGGGCCAANSGFLARKYRDIILTFFLKKMVHIYLHHRRRTAHGFFGH